VWGRSRTVFFSLSALLLIPTFTLTGVVVRLFHEKQAKIAADWERAGEVNLQTSRAQLAIEDFRNSLLYSSDDPNTELKLAEALAAQGQLDEAENYLLNLRNSDPESSPINLELARIAARRKTVDAAVGYYHDAAYGQWPDGSHDNRVAARTELIQFLLQNGRRDQARAEALSLAADNPADPTIGIASAGYLVQTGDPQSAFDEYQRVLRTAPTNAEALVGAGHTALALDDFSNADRYLTRAIGRGAKDPTLAQDRDVAAAAAALDPNDDRITDRERLQRTLDIFNDAEQRARTCFPGVLVPVAPGVAPLPDSLKPLATARATLPARVTLNALTAQPDLATHALNWAFDAESFPAPQCTATLADRAIALVAAKSEK
jgi:tetratricopeptide (TPR) repeat protein